MSSLGEQYPIEQERCRELISQYELLRNLPNVNCAFAIAAIKDVLRRADEAAIGGDVVAMLRSYEEMKGCS